MRLLIAGLAALVLAAPATAQRPQDFAWAFPLQTPGEAEAYVVELDESIYARLARDDLRDLMVFDASGQPVPFAPQPQALERAVSAQPLHWLQVPRESAKTPATDLLVDLGEAAPAVSALRLVPADGAAGHIDLRVNVLASDDLANWRLLAGKLALVSLYADGLRIERLRLDFPPSRTRYLRLSLASGDDWPALTRIEHLGERVADDRPPPRELVLEGEPVAGEPGSFRYTLPGPMPIEAWDVRLASPNSVAQVSLEQQLQAEGGHSLRLGTITAFRLGNGDSEVRQLPVEMPPTRARHWQLRSTPALAQAPRLHLQWRPDRFVLLAQPPAPYALHAGSGRVQRPDYPVDVALGALSEERGSRWTPPLARVGAATEAGGDAALRPDPGPRYRRWALWAVLAAAGLLVLAMALRVLRHPAG